MYKILGTFSKHGATTPFVKYLIIGGYERGRVSYILNFQCVDNRFPAQVDHYLFMLRSIVCGKEMF